MGRVTLACLLVPALTMTAHADAAAPPRPEPSQLEELTATESFSLGRPTQFQWTPDGAAVLYLRSGPRDRKNDLWMTDLATGEERRLLSAEELLGGGEERLSAAEQAERERRRIKTAGFTGFALSKDGERVVLKLSGKVWLHERSTGRTARVALPDGVVLDPRLSPDGKRLAFVRDHDLYAMRVEAVPEKQPKKGPRELEGRIVALTKGGSEQQPHGLAEFVAQEEMARFQGYWWSPDGRQVAYQANDYRHLERLTIADASSPESPAHVFPYPRAGKDNAHVRLFVVGVDGKGRKEIAWDRERFPYLARVVWPKNGPLTLLVQSRDQRVQQYLRADVGTGRTTLMHEDRDDAWLNLSRSTPEWLADGASYLWATEEAGAWRLERRWPKLGGKKGGIATTQVVVEADAGYASLAHVDEERGLVWFLGGPSPAEVHLFRAPLDGSDKPQQVTAAGGVHAASFAKDGSAFVLTSASLEAMPRARVVRVEGLAAPLAADAGRPLTSVAEEPRIRPQVELVPPEKAGGFHAAIVRPRGFEPNKRYPVIQYVYGGPGHNVVHAAMSTYFVQQWMADHGFVVVSLDGRGTQRRGREWERALRGKFGSVPLEDQVRGLQALGQSYPELDLARTGIYGWSFGGYLAALAVLRRPDVYKAAVAGAPVVDWLYYDTHYTERYLGLPAESAEAYREASLLTWAKDLERPLLLVHGIADDNVYFAHSLQLADALFRAGRRFELLPLVRLTHQIADPAVRRVLYERMVGFLGAAL